jgi:ABC-type bacteriocin/lantibiotic exporter with double-glycine peptidase domain
MKFPNFKQFDSMDCGPSCLRMVAKFCGMDFSLQTLQSRTFITKSVVSMLGISDAAESIGSRTRGYRLAWEQLYDEVPYLSIVHWNQRHFVVECEIRNQKRINTGCLGQGANCFYRLDRHSPLPALSRVSQTPILMPVLYRQFVYSIN